MVLGTTETLHALAVRAAALVDIGGDGGRADEADGLNCLVVEDRVDALLVAIDDLQDVVGQARFGEQLGKHQADRGVTLGWFQDEGVAAGQGRAHFPKRDHRGEVERGDARDDTQRLTHREHVDARPSVVGVFALQQMRRTDAEFDDLKTPLHVSFGVRDGLAMFTAQRLGQLVHVAVYQAHHFHHHAGAFLRVSGGPGGLGGGGAVHGSVKLGLRGKRNLGLHLARCWVEHIGKAPGCSSHTRAANVVS